MDRPGDSSERFSRHLREILLRGEGPHSDRITGHAVRAAALTAARGTRSVGIGAGSLARETAEGTVRAVGAMGGEAGAFVRDTVIGVIQGTGEAVTISRPVVREVVLGAIRGSTRLKSDIGDAGREAVAGAIEGTASFDINNSEAVAAAVEGAVEAVAEAGGDLGDAARITVGGVVSGVSAAGGDVEAAARDATDALITHVACSEQGVNEITGLAESAVEAVLEEADSNDAVGGELAAAAARGAVEAAYRVGPVHGDTVRASVISSIRDPRTAVALDLERQLPNIAEQLSNELPPRSTAWRLRAMLRAVRLFFSAGGIDLAASLAYFTVLSLFPLVALVIMAATIFVDSEAVSGKLAEILSYYFPGSTDLIRGAIENLLSNSIAIGLVSLATIVVGANGLIQGANRALNRVFGTELRKIVRSTAIQTLTMMLLAILFLMSIWLTASFQTAVSISEGFLNSTETAATLASVILGILSTVLPVVLTVAVFAIVYHHLPNTRVEWRDATFGAVVAVVLFEGVKYVSFWFTGVIAERSAIYGPVASVMVLLMWAYIGGVVFLYGAALTRVAGELRPHGSLGATGR